MPPIIYRRADIEEMMKRTGLKLESTASSAESGGPVGKAAKMQEQMFMSAVAECTEFPSFAKRLYPCWVISLTNLIAFDELPYHEGNSRCIRHRCIQLHNIDAERSLPTDALLFSRRRRNTKIASRSSKNCSPTAQARRARSASSSRKTGKVDGWVHPVMGSTTCAVTRIPITSSTLRRGGTTPCSALAE